MNVGRVHGRELLRPYSAGDEHAVVGLFEEAFGRCLARRVWEWRFLRNPAGHGTIELAWVGGTLAGHYAVSPTRMRIRGEDVLAGLSGTTMVHSQYRGLGLFPKLARQTYGRARDAGQKLVMGFPNSSSHRGLVRDLGWGDVHEVPQFAADVRDIGGELDDPGVIELERFDRRFDWLWEDIKDATPVSVVRNQRYLQWRFVENPENRYRIFAYQDRATLAGYAVAKRYQDQLHMVDILCRDPETGVRLTRRVARAASAQGVPVVSAWLNPGLGLHHELERLGFQPRGPVTYFCVLALDPAPGLRGAYDFQNWYLTMGDSDVY
jgi:hypothetical protein